MQDVLSKMELFQTELEKNGFQDNSERVKQKYNDFNEPFMLMVIGEGNYGKSTLINSLFNKQVAPTSRLPKTWKIDIYENSNKDEAILFFKNLKTPQNVRNVSIEEASLICEQEENKAKTSDNWKSELFQVKWKLKSDWIENILLIDTPGFSQFRANSTYENFNLFGTKGIQLQSFDGFEYYFYRADFIFWCIKATKIEDADTLNALKNVSEKKANIIGIITFMERIPNERWEEIKLKACEIYGEYISEFLFFSPKEDNNTVAEIKDYINTKINTNLRELKNTSLLNYYNEEINNYCNSLNKTSDVYDKNISKYLILIDAVNKDIDRIEKKIESEHKRIFDLIKTSLKEKLNSIYYKSNENPNTFKYLIETELLNRQAIQKQIDPIFHKIKDEISSLTLSLQRKINWETLLLSNTKSVIQNKIIIYDHHISIIDTSNYTRELNISFSGYFEDAFNADSFGKFLGNLFIGILDWLFGGSKQTKIVNQTNDELTKHFNKIEFDTNKNIKEMMSNYKKEFIDKINVSFHDFNGFSKDDILKNFYWTDSVFSNKLQIKPNSSIIDCLNDEKQLLTYFPKLLKYDSVREPVWDKNADKLFNNEVDNIFNKINKEIYKVENDIKNLINDKKLADLELFNNEIASLNKYLTTTILSNPFVSSTDFVERLVYSNGIKVNIGSYTYNSTLQKTKSLVLDKKRELQLLWDQKVIDLVWDSSKNKLYKSFIGKDSKFSQIEINDYCDYKSKVLLEQIYSNIVEDTKTFDPLFKVDIHSHNAIRLNLIPHFQSKKYSFSETLNKEIQNDKNLSSLKTFNISKQAKFIDDAIQSRLTNIINEMPNPISLVVTYKRFSVRILLSIFPLIIIGANHLFPFNFIEDLAMRENIQRIISSEITLIAFSFLFLLLIFMQIKTRFKMKREIKAFVKNIFNEYGEELYKKIQNKFTNNINIRLR